MVIEEKVEIFFKEAPTDCGPLLLAFSGGSDSLALAHLLCERGVKLHLAHFDHGWREKSGEEALSLAQIAKEMGLPFFTERSSEPDLSEEGARKQRYAFLHKCFRSHCYQALVLAHHADDQAETVLKRLLEGAHFHKMQAMRPIARSGEGIPLWRPLLQATKEEILSYIERKALTPLVDPTNEDKRYLRVRMRREILPYLRERFGKNIGPPLARLSELGAQLSEYLEGKTREFEFVEGPDGLQCDLAGAHPVEINYILSQAPFPTPSHHSLKKIYKAVESRERRVEIAKGLFVDRGRLYLVN